MPIVISIVILISHINTLVYMLNKNMMDFKTSIFYHLTIKKWLKEWLYWVYCFHLYINILKF